MINDAAKCLKITRNDLSSLILGTHVSIVIEIRLENLRTMTFFHYFDVLPGMQIRETEVNDVTISKYPITAVGLLREAAKMCHVITITREKHHGDPNNERLPRRRSIGPGIEHPARPCKSLKV